MNIASEKQKNDALKLGLAAHEDGLSCIPAHDKKLMVLIKELSGHIGASKPLLESWIRGWHKAHSIPNRAAAHVTADKDAKMAKGYIEKIIGNYILAGDLKMLHREIKWQ